MASQILVRNKTRRITVFTPSFPAYFWDDIKKGAYSAGEYIKPLNYEVRYHRMPDYDTDAFVRIVKKEIESGLDAAAFPHSWQYNMKEIVNPLDKEGIPYVFLNVDSGETKRVCYIGSNYLAGGKLAANFIGKSLSMKKESALLVIGMTEPAGCTSDGQDINQKRIEGFMEVMRSQHPSVSCITRFIHRAPDMDPAPQIREILENHEKKVDAVYFVPAFNDIFVENLERFDYRGAITVLHDITEPVLRRLKTDILTAAVYQEPVLQGYMAVKVLEDILETRRRDQRQDIEIAHTLIFKENICFLRRPYLLTDNCK
jgi:LacI family transcriptional regulator